MKLIIYSDVYLFKGVVFCSLWYFIILSLYIFVIFQNESVVIHPLTSHQMRQKVVMRIIIICMSIKYSSSFFDKFKIKTKTMTTKKNKNIFTSNISVII